MQSPSVASNGTKVGEDETEVLAGSREVSLCLPIDLGTAFRFRLRNALLAGQLWTHGRSPPHDFRRGWQEAAHARYRGILD